MPKTKPRVAFNKLVKKQQDDLKKNLLSEVAVSLADLVDAEDLEPWTEVVEGREYIFKKIENMVNFGTLILTFVDKENSEKEIRLPLQLMLT